MACLRVSRFQVGAKSVLLVKEKHSIGKPSIPIVCNRCSKSRSHHLRVVANPNFTETGAFLRSNQANLAIPWESIPIDDVDEKEKEREITSERLDQWLRESVTEIVSNIDEAPFLMQIQSNGEMVMVKAIPNGWSEIKQRWESGRCRKPNGIILVKELESCSIEDDDDNGDGNSSNTKVWGILIQGKGVNSACYVLKTCRVKSTFGYSTHFYVFRMDSFQESLENQLKNLWLV
ncbi:uncharacterized protein LOC124920259 [Impatiens glandulifera]|uniref:uncharacterized protein LOC124920259 n=1 Tax=Impatiens glandulifera TaxID=253017 RepID=UPI001FB17F1C|nr:uncharacterized protein LOC124920259 [Impatiens glandulifera]